MIGDDKTSSPHRLLLADRQVASQCNSFANKLSANTKFLKTQLSEIIQSGGQLGKLLKSFIKIGLPLMKNVLHPLSKGLLIPPGLTSVASAADAGFHKKF